MQTYIFVGRSGCGKGTQANILEEYLKKNYSQHPVLHVSSGDEFRKFAKEKNYSGDIAGGIMKEGGLPPTFLSIHLWSDVLVENVKNNEHIIIDGFPRRPSEAEILDTALGFYKRERPTVILIRVSEEEATKRLLARKRGDDELHNIKIRMDWYNRFVLPTTEFYREHPWYNFVEVNGEQSVEGVSKEMIAKIFK
jgi:adenylate kinase